LAVLRVVKVLPQEQMTSVVVYSGWIPLFMSSRSLSMIWSPGRCQHRAAPPGRWLGREPEPCWPMDQSAMRRTLTGNRCPRCWSVVTNADHSGDIPKAPGVVSGTEFFDRFINLCT
jgi:hypothetical protein